MNNKEIAVLTAKNEKAIEALKFLYRRTQDETLRRQIVGIAEVQKELALLIPKPRVRKAASK